MSTRAQIAIQIGPEDWAHIYSHYDGYPSHMLPALAPWTPEDILAAREIRQVRAGELVQVRRGFYRPRADLTPVDRHRLLVQATVPTLKPSARPS